MLQYIMEKANFLNKKYRIEYTVERDGPRIFYPEGFDNTNEAFKKRDELLKGRAFDAVVKSNEHGV